MCVDQSPIGWLDESGGVIWRELVSSWLHSMGYQPDAQTLYVRLDSGQTYVFSHVPEAKALGLLNAESKGRYFHERIHGKYHFRKVV